MSQNRNEPQTSFTLDEIIDDLAGDHPVAADKETVEGPTPYIKHTPLEPAHTWGPATGQKLPAAQRASNLMKSYNDQKAALEATRAQLEQALHDADKELKTAQAMLLELTRSLKDDDA